MHDIGGLIWIILILIGVVSSVRKNARQARARADREAAAQAQPVQVPRPVPVPQAASPQAPAQVQSVPSFVVQRIMAPPIAPISPAPTPPPIVPAPPTPSAAAQRVGTSPIRGMFGGSATLVRAIVVSEVLGPPRALGEHTSWSPRHSEPSI